MDGVISNMNKQRETIDLTGILKQAMADQTKFQEMQSRKDEAMIKMMTAVAQSLSLSILFPFQMDLCSLIIHLPLC